MGRGRTRRRAPGRDADGAARPRAPVPHARHAARRRAHRRERRHAALDRAARRVRGVVGATRPAVAPGARRQAGGRAGPARATDLVTGLRRGRPGDARGDPAPALQPGAGAVAEVRQAGLHAEDLRRWARTRPGGEAGREGPTVGSGGGQALAPVEVGAERARNDDGPVRLLVVLQDRDQRPPDGQTRSRSACGGSPPSPRRRGGSGGRRAAPGTPRSSSRTRSRDSAPPREARPRGRTTWPPRSPCRPRSEARRGMAARVVEARPRRRASSLRARRTTSRGSSA